MLNRIRKNLFRFTRVALPSVVLFTIILSFPVSAAFGATIDALQQRTSELQSVSGSRACNGINPLNWISPKCLVLNLLWLIDQALILVLLKPASQLLDISTYANVAYPPTTLDFVKAGWGMIRDVTNLFFIFILLWIALATIFDIPGYGVKDLLYKLIIAALLVNFSLAIGGFVITLSNSLANIFYKQMYAEGSLSDKLLSFTDIQESSLKKQAVNDIFLDCASLAANQTAASQQPTDDQTVSVDIRNIYDRNKVRGGTEAAALEKCQREANPNIIGIAASKQAKGISDELSAAIFQALWLVIIIPILAFTMGAGAIFLVIRYLQLAFILIAGPLVFLFSVLPITRQYLSSWWGSLFKWSFFAPAYFFLLMLTVNMFPQLSKTFVLKGESIGTITFNMILFVALMIMNLTIAQKMGIYGASAVVGFGKRQTDKLKGAVRGAAYRGYTRAAAATMARPLTESGLGRAMARTPFVRGLLSPALKIQEEKDKLDADRAKQIARAAALSPQLGAARFRGEGPGAQAAIIKSESPESIRRLFDGMSSEDRARAAANLFQNRHTTRLDENMLSQKIGDAMAKDAQGLSLRVTAATGIREQDAGFQEAFTNHMNGLNDRDFAKAITPASIEGNKAFIEYMRANMTGDRRWIEAGFGDPTKIQAMGRMAEGQHTARMSEADRTEYIQRKDAARRGGTPESRQEFEGYVRTELTEFATSMMADGRNNEAGMRAVGGAPFVRALLTNSKRGLYVEAERRDEESQKEATDRDTPSRAPTMTERVATTPPYAGETPPGGETPPTAPAPSTPSTPPPPTPRPEPPSPPAPPAAAPTVSAPSFSPPSGGTTPRPATPTRTPETRQPDIISFADDPRAEIRKMRKQLEELQYSIEDLRTMNEESAREIIRTQKRKGIPPQTRERASPPPAQGGGTPSSPETEKKQPPPNEELPPPIG